ncbi:MAG: 50S ribosomal protein L9 [Phycisphaerales bacterium]
MARDIELLLTENVEGTGIVGDVVRVRKGFARNFLLPRAFATAPSPEKIKELAGKREQAQKALEALRKEREALIAKIEGHAVNLIRSCNDIGILYGGITQSDICEALLKDGYTGIKPRDVRIGAVIKRIGDYDVHIKFEADLEATVKLHVKPDRELETGRRDDKAPEHPEGAAAAEGAAPALAAEGAKPDARKAEGKPAGKPEGKRPDKSEAPARDADAEKGEKSEKSAKSEAKPAGEKAPKGKGEKGKKDDAAPAAAKSKTGWGATAEVPTGLADLLKPKRERRERR